MFRVSYAMNYTDEYFRGIAFHAAISTLVSFIRKREVPLSRDHRKVVTLIFLGLIPIWVVITFVSLLSSTDNLCQGTLVVAFAIDQTTRSIFLALLLWRLTQPIAASFPKVTIRAFILLRLGAAATTAVYIRSSFLPLCVGRVDQTIAPITLLAADGFLMLVALVLLPFFGLIRKVFRISQKSLSVSRKAQDAKNWSITSATCGFIIWTGSSAPMVLGRLGTPLILQISIACVGLIILLAVLICCPAAFVRTVEATLPGSHQPTPKPPRPDPPANGKGIRFISPKISPTFSQSTTPGRESSDSPLIDKKEISGPTLRSVTPSRRPNRSDGEDVEAQLLQHDMTPVSGLGILGVGTMEDRHAEAFPGFTNIPLGPKASLKMSSRNGSPAPTAMGRNWSANEGSVTRRSSSLLRRFIPAKMAYRRISKPLVPPNGPHEFNMPFSVVSLPYAAKIEKERRELEEEQQSAYVPRPPPKSDSQELERKTKTPKSPGTIELPPRDFLPNPAYLNGLSSDAVSPLSPEYKRSLLNKQSFPFPSVAGFNVHNHPADQQLLRPENERLISGDPARSTQIANLHGVDVRDWTIPASELPAAIHQFPKHASHFSGPSPEDVVRREDRSKPELITKLSQRPSKEIWHFGADEAMQRTPASAARGLSNQEPAPVGPQMAERKTRESTQYTVLLAKTSAQSSEKSSKLRKLSVSKGASAYELEDTSSPVHGSTDLPPEYENVTNEKASEMQEPVTQHNPEAESRTSGVSDGLLHPHEPSRTHNRADSKSRFFGGLTSILNAIHPKAAAETRVSRDLQRSPSPSPHPSNRVTSDVPSTPLTSKTLMFCHHPTSESEVNPASASESRRTPKPTLLSPRSPFTPVAGNAVPNNGYLSPLRATVFVRKARRTVIPSRPSSAPSVTSPAKAPALLTIPSPTQASRGSSANFTDVAHYSMMAPSMAMDSPVEPALPMATQSPMQQHQPSPVSPPQALVEQFASLSDAEASGHVRQASVGRIEKPVKMTGKRKKPRMHRYHTDAPDAHLTSLHEKGGLLDDLVVLGDSVNYPELFIADNLQIEKLADLEKFQRRSGPADPRIHPAYLYDTEPPAPSTGRLTRSLSTSEFDRFSILPTQSDRRTSEALPFDIQAAMRQSKSSYGFPSRSSQIDLQRPATGLRNSTRTPSLSSAAPARFRSPWKRSTTNTSSHYSTQTGPSTAVAPPSAGPRFFPHRLDSGIPPVPPINPVFLSVANSPVKAASGQPRQSIDSTAPLTATSLAPSDRFSMALSDNAGSGNPASSSRVNRNSFGFITRGIDKMIAHIDGPTAHQVQESELHHRSGMSEVSPLTATTTASTRQPPQTTTTSVTEDSTLTSESAFRLLNANALLRPHIDSHPSCQLYPIAQSPHLAQVGSQSPTPSSTSSTTSTGLPKANPSFLAHRQNNSSTRAPPPLLSFEDLKARAIRVCALSAAQASAIDSPLELVRAIQSHLRGLTGAQRTAKSSTVRPLLTALAVQNAQKTGVDWTAHPDGRVSFSGVGMVKRNTGAPSVVMAGPAMVMGRRPTTRRLGTGWAGKEERIRRQTIEGKEWDRLHQELNKSPEAFAFGEGIVGVAGIGDGSLVSGATGGKEGEGMLGGEFEDVLEDAFWGRAIDGEQEVDGRIVERQVSVPESGYLAVGGGGKGYGMGSAFEGFESGKGFVMRREGDGSEMLSGGVLSGRTAGTGVEPVRWPSQKDAMR